MLQRCSVGGRRMAGARSAISAVARGWGRHHQRPGSRMAWRRVMPGNRRAANLVVVLRIARDGEIPSCPRQGSARRGACRKAGGPDVARHAAAAAAIRRDPRIPRACFRDGWRGIARHFGKHGGHRGRPGHGHGGAAMSPGHSDDLSDGGRQFPAPSVSIDQMTAGNITTCHE